MTGYEPADDEGPAFEQAISEGDSRRDRLTSTIRKRARNGTLAMLAGGVMLARAARAITRSRSRALARAVAGTGLIAIGVRQRRSAAGPDRYPTAEGPASADTGGSGVTFTEQPDVDRPGTGTDEAFDSESETGDDEIGIDTPGPEPTDDSSAAGSAEDESGPTGESEEVESGADDEPGDEDDR